MGTSILIKLFNPIFAVTMSSSFYLFLSTLNSLTLTFSLSTFVFSSFFFLLYFWYICALLRLTFYIFLFLFCSLLYFYNLSSWVRCFIFLYNLCLLLPLSFFPLFYLSFSSLLYLLAAFNSIASFMLPSFPEPVINPGTESSSSHHTANNLSDTPTTTYFIHKYSATLFRSCWRHLQEGGSTNDVTGSCRL